MPYRTRSARLAASLLSAVVAVLAFVVPSSRAAAAVGTAAQPWVTPAAQQSGTHTTNSPGQQRPRAHGPGTAAYGPESPAGSRAVHATATPPHQAHLPHPPFPGTTGPGVDRAPHRPSGGPDVRPDAATPTARFAHAAPEPRGPPSRRS